MSRSSSSCLMTRKNYSRWIILNLLCFRQTANHGIIYLCLLLLLPALQYAAAQPNSNPPPNPYRFNPKFSPSMAIIIVVLITAFFFMGFFSIYIRQCSGRRNGESIRQAVAGIGRSRRAPRGLDTTVIETFPTFLYSNVKGLKIGKGVLECAVCLNEFEDDETLRLLPKCDHVFHPECIDAWLVSHTTCPVCRANLVPEPDELPGATLDIPDSDGESDQENRRSEVVESPDQVSIRVVEDQNRDDVPVLPDVINPNLSFNQNRPRRSKSTRTRFSGKFPRSHSTGHSLVQQGENCDRFTLRLPLDVRKQIVDGKLNRSTSCVAFPRAASTRRGYRSGGGDGSSRGKYFQFQQLERFDRTAKSDRWIFSMAPPFFSRASSSVRSPRKAVEGDGTAANPKTLLSPLSRLHRSEADEAEHSLSRPPV